VSAEGDTVGAATALAPDAAVALGIAATAMPFARTPAGEAERWLRVLRLHGEAGAVLQALGVTEGPTEGAEDTRAGELTAPGVRQSDVEDPVARVTDRAVTIAAERRAGGVSTRDLLVAVMEIYGEEFDRVLRAHGTDPGEVLQRLGRHVAEG
jgi:hypothetical protein